MAKRTVEPGSQNFDLAISERPGRRRLVNIAGAYQQRLWLIPTRQLNVVAVIG
jgi:hypothetical protein